MMRINIIFTNLKDWNMELDGLFLWRNTLVCVVGIFVFQLIHKHIDL